MTKWASAWSAQFAKERGEKMMMKKTLALTLIAASLFAALFVGCSNMGAADAGAAANSNGATAGGQNGAQGQAVVTVSGSLGFSGAMPTQIAALVNNSLGDSGDATSRSAFPQTPNASSLAISVYAEEVTDSDTKLRYDGTVAADNQSYTVGIPVTSGKKYYVHAVAKKDNVEVLFGKSALLDFTENAEQFYTSRDIALGAQQSATGKGGVYLTVNVEGAGVERARMGYKPKGSGTITWVTGAQSAGGNVRVFSVGFDEDVFDPESAIASGNYLMTFEFYSGAEIPANLVYSFTESVSVFDSLVTDTWVKNGSEPWLTLNGSNMDCQITSAMVDGFKLTEIYVNPNATSTTESGTFLNPKTSFDDALTMLQNANADYTIYIMGRIGSVSISDSVIAKSITLCGADDPVNGKPVDKIDAKDEGTSALTIATTVPVTIKNLMITNGTGTYIQNTMTVGGMTLTSKSYRGGGIYLSAEGGSLILGRGAYVSGNNVTTDTTISCFGGGICLYSSTAHSSELNLMDGAVIAGNGAKNYGGGIYLFGGSKLNIYDGAVIEKNNAQSGGGIYISASLEIAMSGGHIRGNTAEYGGAIYGESGTFTMTGGVIGDDSSTISQAAKYDDDDRKSDYSNTAQYGGAFYFTSTSAVGGVSDYYINLYGGTVAYNCAQNYGGAFYIKNGQLCVKNAAIKYNGAGGEDSKGGGAICFETKGYLWLEDGADIDKNECYNAGALGGAIYIGQDDGMWHQEYVYIRGNVSIPCYGAQKNDVGMLTDSSNPNGSIFTIIGKLTGTEPVVTITPDVYSETCQVVKLFSGSSSVIDVTDVNFALECYKFAVTPQTSPAQEWAVAGDGYLTPVTTLTAGNIADFTYADGDKVIVRVDCADADKIDSLMQKFYKSGVTSEVGDGSVLDLSKTNLTTLGISWSGGVKKQPNLDVIISPKVQYNQFTNQTAACALSGSKNIIVPAHSYTPDSYYLISIDGVVYTKDKKTLVCYPGGKTATSWSVPSGVTNIARYALGYNPTLKNVTLPDGLTTIEWDAFYSSTGLESINIPSSVTQIDRSFRAVNNLTSLNFANKTGWYKGSVTSENLIPNDAFATATDAASYYKDNSLSSYKLVRE